MKRLPLLLAAALATSALPLLAGSDLDAKIERTAKSSYTFRIMLDEQVTAQSADGIVTLSGTLQDPDLRALAEDTVRELPGVMQVQNEISLASEKGPKSDSWIAFKARTTLLTKANVSSATTKLTVKDGAVTITGTAESVAQRDLTAEYIKDVEGAKSVDNQLAVGRPASPDAKPAMIEEKIDDASITALVKYALRSHHSASALRADVTTENGVVRLAGLATSSAEREQLGKLAQGVRGVQSVNNQMRLSD